MSSFTHPDIPRDEAIYDLRGVCSHYGYMNFGHYIAFCKPYSEEELDKFGLKNGEGMQANTVYIVGLGVAKH